MRALTAFTPFLLVVAACTAVLLQHHRRAPVRATQVVIVIGAVLLAMLLASCGTELTDVSVAPPAMRTIIVQTEQSIQLRAAGDHMTVARARGWPQFAAMPTDQCISLGQPAPGETTPTARLWPVGVCQELK